MIRNGKSGFTFMEVITATVIIAILAAGIFSTVSFANRMAIRAHQKTVAISAAEARLSELKAGKAQDLEKGQKTEILNQLKPPVTALDRRRPDGTVDEAKMRIDVEAPEPGEEGVKEVKVTVSWRDQRGAEMSETLVTYLFDV